ncbi:MAG: T9SS type A sorting domain-containing protein, partial [Bacteroidota bacterium]
DLFQFGTISENLKNWPWQLGAPIIDGDGIPDNYNLEGGDLPELLGHQRLWWIMNDRGNVHERFGSEPLGIEVHGTAIGYEFPQLVENNTFYSYQLINKNTTTIEDAYFTFWTDGDLGNFADDYVGSDSLLGLGFYYNADNEDEGGEGYGTAPPAVGFTFLKTPPAENDGLDNDRDGETDESGEELGVTVIMNHQKTWDPRNSQDIFNYARGRWRDGEPMQEGFFGHQTGGATTLFYMAGDPLNNMFWSERNADGAGLVLDPADRRLHASTGPFTLAPGDTMQIAFGVIWARGDDNLDSLRKLKLDVATLNQAGDAILSPSIRENPFPQQDPVPAENHVLGFDQNFPNPFTKSTTIRYSIPQAMRVRLAVFDILGREVAVLVEERQDAGIYSVEFDAGVLPAGVYLARFQVDQLQFTKRMLLVD